METFYLIQRDFFSGEAEVFNFEAENSELAWEKVEEEYSSNNTQEWLFDEKRFVRLCEEMQKWIKFLKVSK
jgi:hypothetical protein